MMLKYERTFTTTYTGGAPNGIAVLHTDGSMTVQPDRGQKLIIVGLAEAVLEENAAYIAWREAQGGTPGRPPVGKTHVEQAADAMVQDGKTDQEIGAIMLGFGIGLLLDCGGTVDEIVSVVRGAAAKMLEHKQ